MREEGEVWVLIFCIGLIESVNCLGYTSGAQSYLTLTLINQDEVPT